MPILTNKRGNANRDIVYSYIGVAYTSGETYTIPETCNRLELRNMSANTLTLTLNGLQRVIQPFKSIIVAESYSSFVIAADVNSSAFEVMAMVDKEDDAGSEVDSIREQLNDKANKVQGNWIAPTLLNGWVNYASGTNTIGYMKDQFGFVHLRGWIQSGTTTSGTVLFKLPEGYRPAATETFAISQNSVYGRVEINAAGDVIARLVSAVYTSFDGILYKSI